MGVALVDTAPFMTPTTPTPIIHWMAS